MKVAKKSILVIMPNSPFKMFWNMVLILLLLYTASITPFKMAFIDTVPSFVFAIDVIVDTLFVVDLFINFFSAYENLDGSFEL